MSFERWRARLAGEKVVTYLQPDAEDEGYYRKPITEPKLAANGQRNGQKRIIGWEPVAYFIDRGKLCGVIGDRDMAINEVTDESRWSWVVRHPISEELYRAVAERDEPWPDLKQVGIDLVPGDGFQIPTSNERLAPGTIMGESAIILRASLHHALWRIRPRQASVPNSTEMAVAKAPT